mgnify:CR=1 FL=1
MLLLCVTQWRTWSGTSRSGSALRRSTGFRGLRGSAFMVRAGMLVPACLLAGVRVGGVCLLVTGGGYLFVGWLLVESVTCWWFRTCKDNYM